ncbi:hypothetical protein [Geopseudomonas aromaticivorans]
MKASDIDPEHGIVRNNADDGWYVVPVSRGVAPKPFYDAAFDRDPGVSYAAAKVHNAELRPFKGFVRNHRIQRKDKARQDLPIGITFAIVDKANQRGQGRTMTYNFKVSLHSGLSTTVYIGTQNTWERNYEKCLAKAIEVRERSRAALLKDSA